ncbi:hypothetical protein [Stenotrophomonas geniculata]|uniref:hypothetical protein n=1 Tax=Stenotrophomonas geniculata TaxID=86188 RepID=UPI002E76C280|nr:hypothetical protein [Stenotrophomonas geniculata]
MNDTNNLADTESTVDVEHQLKVAKQRIAELEGALRAQTEAHHQVIAQREEAKFGQLQALLKLESAGLRPMPDVDVLAKIIREVDGNNSLGAGALAEAILTKLDTWDVPFAGIDPGNSQALDVVLESLFPGKWDRHTRENWREPVAKAMSKALPHLFAGIRDDGVLEVLRSLGGSPMLHFSLPQVLELLATFGGENAEVAVQKLPARTVGDEQLPAGLYAHSTDYPDEGVHYLGDLDADCSVELARVEAMLPSDGSLIDHLAANCLDLRCIRVPTGGGDAEVEWVVIEHQQAEPQEREIGRASNPRKAIEASRSADN